MTVETIEYANVRLEIEGGLATIVLADPERLNALSGDMVLSVINALQEVAKPRRGIRALMLTGEGRGFCSGANLGGRRREAADDAAPKNLAALGGVETLFHPLVRRLRDVHCPVIAAAIALIGPFIPGVAHRLDAAWHESIAKLEEALRWATSGSYRQFEGRVRAELATALLGRGDLDPAEQEADRAVTVARMQHSRCDEVWANLALAHTQIRRADAAALARAEQALLRAQALIDETGARAFQPEVHECRAHLARLRGDALAAQREIEAARRLYAAMCAVTQAERLAKDPSP